MSSAAEAQRPISPAAGRSSIGRWARRYALQIGVVFVALFVWVIFVAGAPRVFLSYDIYNSLMITTPYFAIVAIPLTLVVITAEIDLSFTSIMAWGMAVYSIVWQATGNVYLGFIGCLLAGFFAGWLNGFIVVKLGIPSLVATIGTQFFWAGLVILITNAQGIGLTPVRDTILYPLFVGRVAGFIPMQFIWTIIVAVVAWFFLNRHKFGAHVYLTGDNVESARLMGVNVERTKMEVFAIVGVAAAFAYFIQSIDLLFFWPTGGQGFLLGSLASVFLGGTSVFGGAGSVFGTFVAAFIINTINPGIVSMGLTGYWTQVIYGLIIVISVALQAVLRKKLA